METRSGNVLENTRGCSRDGVRVLMAYDGSGRRVSKTRMRKERDDETALNFFGARYLDPMLGMWISVDPKRQFASPYLYVGNGSLCGVLCSSYQNWRSRKDLSEEDLHMPDNLKVDEQD